jgi:outer membrane biosynthesis protein TonB
VRGLWLWFLARSLPMKIALVLIILALAAFLSPILSALAILALIVSLIVLLVHLVRGRPLRNWGLAAVASFALIFVFSGVSNAVYGPPPQEEATAPEKGEEPLPKTTAEQASKADTTQSEPNEAEQAAARSEPEPERRPEPKPEPEPKPQPEAQPAARPQKDSEDRSSKFDATAMVSQVVDGDTIEITPAIGGRRRGSPYRRGYPGDE